jgi:tetratricopeptide (TPR) repeat protein
MTKFCLSLAFLACIALHSPNAHAQDDPAEEFGKLVEQAREAYGRSDFNEAIRLLQRANMVLPNSRLLINIAKSYENLNKCASALAYYKAYLRASDTEDSLVKASRDALKNAKRCKEFNDSLSGRILIRTKPAEASIYYDGELVGPAPLELIALQSGEHKVRIELDGYVKQEHTFTAKSNEDSELTYTLEKVPVVVKEDPPPDDPPPGDDPIVPKKQDEPSSLNIPAIALLGTGVLALGVGAYFDLSAIPSTDEERRNVPADSDRFRELTDQRSSQATFAITGYVIGAVLIAGGAGWLIYDIVSADDGDKKKSSAEGLVLDVRLQPVVGPSAGGFMLEGRFW